MSNDREGKRTKEIVVTAYNPDWPKAFEKEEKILREALGSNCVAIHHVGSTAVKGLAAKPIIDILVVLKNREKVIETLENLGFVYKGEYNIPMRLYFSRPGPFEIHLHVYEEGHAEIELNLVFRDYLRSHSETCNEYAALKENLLKERSSYERKGSSFSGYNLGKDAWIRKILQKAHFNRIRMVKCMHRLEWEAAKRLRQTYFFDPLSIEDPYTWTFEHKDHVHLILYHGVDIAGYAHIQFWPNHRAALRIFVIEEKERKTGLGSQFLQLCEKWLKIQGVLSLHDEARPDAVFFYRKNGYVEMPFDDPSGEPPSQSDIALGRAL